LGPGDRAFESHYSDQNPAEINDFSGVFSLENLDFFIVFTAGFENPQNWIFLCLLRRKIRAFGQHYSVIL